MISAQEIQERRRRDELLRRQLGPRLLAEIANPNVTEIIVNEDGSVWLESYDKGLIRSISRWPRARWKA